MKPERKKPSTLGWSLVEINQEYTVWKIGEIFALSSVVWVEDEHLPPHWEWLISFSAMGRRRLSNKEISIMLPMFSAEEFEEDNHEKGVSRKFWLAVEKKHRVPCPCKDEMVITEGDYKYSVKKDKP